MVPASMKLSVWEAITSSISPTPSKSCNGYWAHTTYTRTAYVNFIVSMRIKTHWDNILYLNLSNLILRLDCNSWSSIWVLWWCDSVTVWQCDCVTVSQSECLLWCLSGEIPPGCNYELSFALSLSLISLRTSWVSELSGKIIEKERRGEVWCGVAPLLLLNNWQLIPTLTPILPHTPRSTWPGLAML